MILQEDHELLRISIEGRPSAMSLLSRIPLSLVQISPFDRRDQFLRGALVIGIITFAWTRHRDSCRMVKVVVPGGIESAALLLWPAQSPRVLKFIFREYQRL